jgi:hypothetical protein
MNWVSTVPARNCWLLSTFCRKGMLVCKTEAGREVSPRSIKVKGEKRLQVRAEQGSCRASHPPTLLPPPSRQSPKLARGWVAFLILTTQEHVLDVTASSGVWKLVPLPLPMT